MASHSSPYVAGSGSEDQERLLDEMSTIVKEQAFYMKRAIDNDNLREALKHSANIIGELRTSVLSPKNYYELYMLVFQEMQHLATFFGDKPRHGRKMTDLYESVQHASLILPRMYLLATVGPGYLKSKETAAREILRDMNELTKGVQHPMRGLFLRYYLSQMVKDKLPDTGSEYEGDGGNIHDAFEFIYTNFCESNRLWVRMQNQGAQKEKQKREKERHDLRVLVGSNLVHMSRLEGMTAEYYSAIALPKILEHIVSVKDTMSQQYLFECMIQVFPDEFHIRNLEKVLDAYRKATPAVDMKQILVALMNRLAGFLMNCEDGPPPWAPADIFALIRSHMDDILDRAMDPAATANGGTVDISAPLEVQAAFMSFTISLYPDKIQYVDLILGQTATLIVKYFSRTNSTTNKLGGPGAEKVSDLLSCPLKTYSLNVLEMENYSTLLSYLAYHTRKQVAVKMLGIIHEERRTLSSVEAVNHLFSFIGPLIRDEEDTPAGEAKNSPEEFAAEQHQVCKLVHQIRAPDIDTEFAILTSMRSFFGQGGNQRMVFTLVPIFYACLGLVTKLHDYDRRLAEEGEAAGPQPALTLKKVFHFLHKTTTALAKAAPDEALRLWLAAASSADQMDRLCGQPGACEPFCFEFVSQALLTFEEEINDTVRQFEGIVVLVGTLSKFTCLDADNFDTISQKITKHGVKLLKKPMQCRAVAACSHLFWCQMRRDSKRVLECMQKCLKIAEGVVNSDASAVGLWVELLDKYIYFFEVGCEEVTCDYVQTLMNLCLEHITFAENDHAAQAEARKAKAHLRTTVAYLRNMKAGENQEIAAKLATLSFDEVRSL